MKKPLIYAHRGDTSKASENTLAAFEHALNLGADGIEFDVMLANDDTAVVTHNNDLSILTKTSGLVQENSAKKLQALGIPSLSEVLDFFAGKNLSLILEIKSQKGNANKAAQVIGKSIEKFSKDNDITCSSFSLPILFNLHSTYPHLKLAIISKFKLFAPQILSVFSAQLEISALTPMLSTISPKLRQMARTKNIPLIAWTVNTQQDIQHSLDLELDGIITDDVSRAKTLIQKHCFTN